MTQSIHTYRYALLLGFTEKQFCEAVALTCARNKNLEQAKAICWLVYSH